MTEAVMTGVSNGRNTEAVLAQTSRNEIVLVRHGETDWTLNGRHTSRTDIPLTAHGEEQTRAVKNALCDRHFGLVLTSPRQRSIQTSVIAGFPAAETDPDLAEWDYGAYEGLTTPEIAAADVDEWDLWRDGIQPNPDGMGEHAEDIVRRTQAIISRARATLSRGEDVLLFSHGHYLRALAAIWIGAPLRMGASFELDTASISTLGFEHRNQVIRHWNECPWQNTSAIESLPPEPVQKKTKFLSIPELLQANLHGVFGAKNDADRLRAAEQAYSPDVTFTDPEGTFVGLPAVVARAKTLADEAPGNWRFTDEGPIYSDQDSAALAWALGPANTEPAARGIDIVKIAAGQITNITTMLVQPSTDE